MKVWIVNHYAAAPSVGRSTRHFELSKQLQLSGHQVTIIAADNHHGREETPNRKAPYKTVKEEGVEFLFLKTPIYQGNGAGRIWNILVFTRAVLRLKNDASLEKPDVIVGSSVHPLAAWAAERLASGMRVPFVFEVRDLWPQTLIDMGALHKWHPVSLILRSLEKYLYKKAQKILVLLPFAHEYICQYKIPRSKIAYLPNGVDVKEFGETDDFKEHNPVLPLTVMYIGSHGVANSLDSIIDAAQLINQHGSLGCGRRIVWRFIGDGPDKTRLIKKAEELELDNIFFEASVPKSDIAVTMREADILILNLMQLSIYQFGISLNKLHEYLASAKPIIFGCAARNNPVADADAGITVNPGDAEAFASSIRLMANMSPSELQAMGRRGREYVNSHNSFTELGKKFEHFLKEVVSGAHGNP